MTEFLRGGMLALGVLSFGCQRSEPPGAHISASGEPAFVGTPAPPPGSAAAPASEPLPSGSASRAELGTPEDNLPFAPTGEKLASIAWRTWVYTDTGVKRTRFGYLRAGAIVDRRGPPVVNDGCAGGWYRVNPRGFVCVGKGASLDVSDTVARTASIRPTRGRALPYLYVMADEDDPPHLYFRLPSPADVKHVEGEGAVSRALAFRERIAGQKIWDPLPDPDDPPEFLTIGKSVVKPYGVSQRLHYSVHAGRAAPDSGFAVARVFKWNDRIYGLTTEHDVIALDRTRVIRPSTFHGVELGEGEELPVAFMDSHSGVRYRLDEATGQLRADGSIAHREAIKLTGRKRATSGTFLEARDGSWISPQGMRLLAPREVYPSFATGDRKWIDVSINQQSLVAYTGRKPVYATLVSTGRGGLGDPEKVDATVRGTFMIYQKDVSSTMDGAEDRSDGYALEDVPFVQYFHKGYALHGTYWHDEFGKIRSHGCVNLAPQDAAWLFEWTDPNVPQDWHGVINKERGTVVFIHP